ncbi:Cytochrome c oxidase subunit 6A1, mitochondrial [Manis javanica]|nr:Cytochrome c oxidase subunit 6A1, mitochondrial [Manis javanica]
MLIGTHDEQGSACRWKVLTYLVKQPLMGVNMLKSNQRQYERPKFIAYSHFCIRLKPFSWGDGSHTLFHNPPVHQLPTDSENDQREPGLLPSHYRLQHWIGPLLCSCTSKV